MSAEFRQKLIARQPLIGTWAKTPSMIIAEVLGKTPLDCVCLDAEHCPFDRGDLDSGILALRAEGMPALVRIPSLSPEYVLSALDCGAGGIVAPHVRNVAETEALAKMCQFGDGGRGYAGSSRAAGYTTKPMADHQRDSAASISVIAQIEDLEAVDQIEAISAVEGIDCLFIGRTDLTVAIGAETPNDPRVLEMLERICSAGKAANRAVGMFLADMSEIPRWVEAGCSFFLLKSDHAFILDGAKRMVDDFHQFAGSSTR